MTTSHEANLSVYDGRYAISGRGMWVELAWNGKREEAPYRLSDRREYYDVVAAGEFAQIAGQVWLEVEKAGSAQDLLWTTGMALTVVSRRLAKALADILDEDEFSVFPVPLRRGRSPDIDDYLILIPAGEGPDRRVREFPFGRRATWSIDVEASVLKELRARGIDKFDVADARKRADDIAAEAVGAAAEGVGGLVFTDAVLWDAETTPAATALTLTIEGAVEPSSFAVPLEVIPESENVTLGADGAATVSAPHGEEFVLCRPVAQDGAGAFVNAFWSHVGPRPFLNVDHIPGVTTYPVIVRSSLRTVTAR